MGAWGAGSFENDDALDWLGELSESEDAGVLHETLKTLLKSEPDEREAPEASAALAAAEVVAAGMGCPARKLPEEVQQWVEAHPLDNPRALARLSLDAVRELKSRSELRDLWEESSLEEWLSEVRDLETRLTEALQRLQR
ncbi:hypothetical protein BO221_20310 [Archangium sp. Cb G35]|uniref:DUF4259 domain-containing protein n=1 Tax=Archangium sp. Cb G35 TaxID=1920190 RepID=UPI0009363ACA|nr:DUF4259 domain-containing protein [Archangium sp. Cb G35]OJT23213.1 hypothetical protein BO221_20310 [Archangium sp. Cb G35]